MWQHRIHGLGHVLDSGDLLLLRGWIVEINYTIASLAAVAAQKCKDDFHARWCLLRKGGREAHAFVRDAATPRIDAPGHDDLGKPSAQAAVDAELENWKEMCWMPPAGFATARPERPAGPLLAPITAEELGKAYYHSVGPRAWAPTKCTRAICTSRQRSARRGCAFC